MSTESSKIVCRICGVTKTRYLDGRYANKKDKRWVDKDGVQFNGLMCSTCNRERVAKAKREKHQLKLRKRK
jgi:hypothetical protein